MLTKKTVMLNKAFDNLYVLDFIYRLLGYGTNRYIEKITSRFQGIDSILDYETFKREMEGLPVSKTEIRSKYVSSDSDLYGHFNAFLKYAGLERISPRGFYIEHGVNFSKSAFPQVILDSNAIIVCQSDYKRTIMKSEAGDMKPIIAVGPYIRYAEDYYTKEQYESVKQRFGKTLLVYPSHTWEKSNIKREYENYEKNIVERYQNSYDTIMICVYWHDIYDPLYEYLSKRAKTRLVSAGFRTDPNFIRRTKALIQLSDKVVVTGIGTYVGYAVCMGKEVEYVNCGDSLHDNNMSALEMNAMRDNQNEVIQALTSKNERELARVYNQYWGGDSVRTPEEMRALIEGTMLVIRESKGRKKRFAEVIAGILRGEIPAPKGYAALLREATGG